MTAAASIPTVDPLDVLPSVATVRSTDIRDIDALLERAEPILLKGAIDHWPALEAAARSPATLDVYLKGWDSGAPVPVMETPSSSDGRFGYAADVREFS